MSEKFDQTKYIIKYIKEHKKRFAVDLNNDEYYELISLLEKHKLTRVDFVRKAIEELKNK